MPHPIVMPSFGMYTAEGTLHTWTRPDGALVQAGELIAEIETEKSTNEIQAPASGCLRHVARLGAPLKEQEVFGYILQEGESASEAAGWVRASPSARKIARENDIDLATVRGNGPGGRVIAQDVRDEVERRSAFTPVPTALPLSAPPLPVPSLPGVRTQGGLSPIRRAIAKRLRQSQSTVVSLTLTRDAPAGGLAAARRRFSTQLGTPVAYDAYFAKCIAMALRDFGQLNAMIQDDELIVFEDIHIGVAVDLPDGLIVPVLRHVDRTPLRTIAAQLRDLAARARAHALRTEELAGGTFSLTNLGGFGVDAFTPVLNPPQSGILGIGQIRPKVVARQDGSIAVEQITTLSLSFDHRVADGAPAARLLDRIVYWMNDDEYLARLEKEQ